MITHNFNTLKRDIKFIEKINVLRDVSASDSCCWNCLWSVMTYEGLWCEKDMDEVNLRDLCDSWQSGSQISKA
ncbi:MAG: hypothetical protein HXY52_02395 [Nitrospirae bacterium]|nr:hypothetical protein [Nitrospirota bacterium]